MYKVDYKLTIACINFDYKIKFMIKKQLITIKERLISKFVNICRYEKKNITLLSQIPIEHSPI